MPRTLIYMESANLFVGDEDPTNEKALAIEEVKLPDLTGKFVDHMPGGSPVAIEIQVGIDKLEPSFKLKGFDADLVSRFSYGTGARMNFTIYGNMVDLRTGVQSEGQAIINGRLGKVASDAFKKGEVQSADYAIQEVVRYEVIMGGQELVYFDFFEGIWRTPRGNNDVQRRNIRLTA